MWRSGLSLFRWVTGDYARLWLYPSAFDRQRPCDGETILEFVEEVVGAGTLTSYSRRATEQLEGCCTLDVGSACGPREESMAYDFGS